jgi:hypothetical protein
MCIIQTHTHTVITDTRLQALLLFFLFAYFFPLLNIYVFAMKNNFFSPTVTLAVLGLTHVMVGALATPSQAEDARVLPQGTAADRDSAAGGKGELRAEPARNRACELRRRAPQARAA